MDSSVLHVLPPDLSGGNTLGEKQEMVLGPGSIWEVVNKFCYLGDMIGAGSGAEEASRARVRCSWSKFRELTPILTSRGATLKAKGRIYNPCVQSVMVFAVRLGP